MSVSENRTPDGSRRETRRSPARTLRETRREGRWARTTVFGGTFVAGQRCFRPDRVELDAPGCAECSRRPRRDDWLEIAGRRRFVPSDIAKSRGAEAFLQLSSA